MVDYVAAMMDLVPNANISYQGTEVDYDDVNWLDERPQPTREECEERWVTLEVELTNNQIKRSRQAAFEVEADPLYFGWKRGENTEQEWLDKVTEIRERFPYFI